MKARKFPKLHREIKYDKNQPETTPGPYELDAKPEPEPEPETTPGPYELNAKPEPASYKKFLLPNKAHKR